MKSPLEYDGKIVKEYGITNDVDQDAKIGFVRTQLDQIKSALYRERVDLVVSETQVEQAEDDIMRNQHQGKVGEHRLMIKQFNRTIDVLGVLLEELEFDQKEE